MEAGSILDSLRQLTGQSQVGFTFGSGETKAEPDEIIRRSRELWPA